MKKHQSGFTLVEIAIVLVIIGLLLGGVLKGQGLLENAKIKALQNEFKSVATMMYGYQDKYKALPGDDPAAVTHQANATQATAGAATTGNALIDTGTWVGVTTAPVAGNESSLFWQQVRLAELATGSQLVGEAINAVGGKLGITSNASRVTTPANVPGTFFICSSGISGKLARQLDIAMDDGVATTGSVFAAVETAGPIVTATAAAPYVDASTYTVCQAI